MKFHRMYPMIYPTVSLGIPDLGLPWDQWHDSWAQDLLGGQVRVHDPPAQGRGCRKNQGQNDLCTLQICIYVCMSMYVNM